MYSLTKLWQITQAIGAEVVVIDRNLETMASPEKTVDLETMGTEKSLRAQSVSRISTQRHCQTHC